MTTVEAVTELTLDRFHKCLEEGKPVSALGHLLIIVHLEPTLKPQLCPVLLSLLGSLSISLAAEQRYDDLLKCYEEILEVYGDNEVVLNNIGSQLYRHYKEIFVNLKLVQRSLKPGYLWDRCPFLPQPAIHHLIEDLIEKGVFEHLDVMALHGDAFVFNKNALLRLLTDPENYFKFFDINSFNDANLTNECSRCVKNMMSEVSGIVEDFEPGSGVLNVLDRDDWSIPCLYGILLGYPTVIYLAPGTTNHCLDSLPLVNCKVRVMYPGFINPIDLYSFSYVHEETFETHVKQWFFNLKLQGGGFCELTSETHQIRCSSITL